MADFSLIPDHYLFDRDTARLQDFLDGAGWSMSLLDLDNERRRRDGRAPYRPTKRKQD